MIKNILVVDDSSQTCKILKSVLESLGYTVITKTSGDAVKTHIISHTEEKPDLLILDVMMPKMDGYQVLNFVKEEGGMSKVPVIMLTSKRREEDLIEGYKNGADYYMTKPTNKDQLKFAIEMIDPEYINTFR